MTQYQVGFDVTQPVQLVFAGAARPVGREIAEQTIYNRDPAVPLVIAFEAPHQRPDFTSSRVSTVDPLSSVVVNGTVDCWGVAEDTGAPSLPPSIVVDVIPTGLGASGSPVAIATALVNSGISLAIAQAISAQGLSLFGNPVPLYGGNLPRTSAGRVGASLDKWTYVPNTTDELSQYPVFDGIVGRLFNTVRRRYYGEGVLPSAGNDSQAIPGSAAAGFKVCVTLKPWRDATNTYGSNNIPGQGSLTYAQHITALKSAVAYLQGAATAGLEICLWHEMNGHGQNGPFGAGGPYGTSTIGQAEANYAAYVNAYGPAFKVATNGALTGNVPLTYCAAVYSPDVQVGFFPQPNVYHTAIVTDYYATDFAGKPVTAPQGVSDLMALADSLNLPFGFWEIGFTNGSVPPVATINQYLTQEITGRMLARLQAGKVNEDVIWFASPQGPPGPSANAPTNTTAPSIIQNMQGMFDQLSTTPSNVLSIAGSSALVVPPLSPTPGAGFAVAQGLSYDITVTLISQGVPTNPFVQVRLDWFNVDAPGGPAVDSQIWRLPIGVAGSAGTVTFGKGPQRGQFLQVTMTNLDTVGVSAVIQVNSTSRAANRDDWRWDAPSSVQVPTFNQANGGPLGNSLGSVNSLSIAAASQKKYLFGMYAGPVYLRLNSNAASGQANFIVRPEPQSDWGTGALLNVNIGLSNDFEQLMNLPRGPVSVTMINNDTVARTFNIEIVASDE